jgi:hypothetical protein
MAGGAIPKVQSIRQADSDVQPGSSDSGQSLSSSHPELFTSLGKEILCAPGNRKARHRLARIEAFTQPPVCRVHVHLFPAKQCRAATIEKFREGRPNGYQGNRVASYLAPYGHLEALGVARELDAKVEALLTNVAGSEAKPLHKTA